MSKLVKCEICGGMYSYKGIHTHIKRAHGTDEEKSKFSDGNNGKYKDFSYIEKLKQSGLSAYSSKFGEKIEFHINCEKCGTEFVKVDYAHKKHQYRFCSRSCANSRQHSVETKQKIANSIIKIANEHRVQNSCINCGKLTDHKKFCDKVCMSQYNRSCANKKSLYRQDCNFDFSLNQYPDYFDFDLIKTHGWYRPRNRGGNGKDGVSRDHIYSVMDGFKNNIDPNIIKHPANCRLILQSENFSKKDKSDITIEDLIEKINKFNLKYGLL